MFSILTAKILYRVVITDHLPSLPYGLDDRPASRGLPSKRDLLRRIHKLYLEYCSKDEPTYPSLFLDGGAFFTLVGSNPREEAEFLGAESDWLGDGLERLREMLPDSQSVSTGVFLDAQTAIHKAADRSQTPIPDQEPRQLRARINLSAVAGYTDICQRVAAGPLAFAAIAALDPNPTLRRPSFTAHLGPATGTLPVVLGGYARWYLSNDTSEPGPGGLQQALYELYASIALHAVDRVQTWRQLAQQVPPSQMTDPPIHVDIYLSGPLATPAIFAGLAKHVGPKTRQVFKRMGVPESQHKKDVWRFHRIEAAPTCKGCSWNPATRESVPLEESEMLISRSTQRRWAKRP